MRALMRGIDRSAPHVHKLGEDAFDQAIRLPAASLHMTPKHMLRRIGQLHVRQGYAASPADGGLHPCGSNRLPNIAHEQLQGYRGSV